jgi:hypothetical protein
MQDFHFLKGNLPKNESTKYYNGLASLHYNRLTEKPQGILIASIS